MTGGIVHQIVNDSIIAPTGHTAATGVVFASFVGWLTPPAALLALTLSIIWYGITIYESATVQKFLAEFREKRKR